MEYIKKTGFHKKQEGLKNRDMIIDYLSKKPEATQEDCANALGLTRQTVHNHIKAIRKQNER
ncbi:MAG TPA: HTH domain-containing protein [Treponemataceae bacterium]|nr:HTH domain-containing protein [Treponemataceae bacterium]